MLSHHQMALVMAPFRILALICLAVSLFECLRAQVFTSCAALQAAQFTSDGIYSLSLPNKSPLFTYQVYCHGMNDFSSAPRAYLEVDPDKNYGLVDSSLPEFSSNAVTSFSKVFFDPTTMRIHTDDFTFAVTNDTATDRVSLGTISTCGVSAKKSSIDLTGHPFDFAQTVINDEPLLNDTLNRISLMHNSNPVPWTKTATLTAKTITLGTSGSVTCATRGHRDPMGIVPGTVNKRPWLRNTEDEFRISVRFSGPIGVGSFPTTCQEVLNQNPGTPDGIQTLSIIGAPTSQYQVYCYDMAGSPAEYLEVDPNNNLGYYYYLSGASEMETRFYRVRFDPNELQILSRDLRFSTTTILSGTPVQDNNFLGELTVCQVTRTKKLVDLSGTNFDLDETKNGVFAFNGAFNPTFKISSWTNQSVTVQGIGSCGNFAYLSAVPTIISPSASQISLVLDSASAAIADACTPDDGFQCTCRSPNVNESALCVRFDSSSPLMCTTGTCQPAYVCGCEDGVSKLCSLQYQLTDVFSPTGDTVTEPFTCEATQRNITYIALQSSTN